jgi:ElaB/YqjD/DUF883 family membrane-anchored ribosome-binding protein
MRPERPPGAGDYSWHGYCIINVPVALRCPNIEVNTQRNDIMAISEAKHESAAPSAGSGVNAGSTTAKVATAAHNAVDIAAENLAAAEKALREARIAAGQKASDTADQAKSFADDAVTSANAYIKLYPLRSVGIALATGYLLSALLKK